VLSVHDNAIDAITFFLNPRLFIPFGLPLVLPAEGGPARLALRS
jgi:hypothetical protein